MRTKPRMLALAILSVPVVAATGRAVVIWCRAFSDPFGSATLSRVT